MLEWVFVMIIYAAQVNTLHVVEFRTFETVEQCSFVAKQIMQDKSHEFQAACVPTQNVDKHGLKIERIDT